MTLKMLITVCYELDSELGDRVSEILKSRVDSDRTSGYSINNAFRWPLNEIEYWHFWHNRVNEYLEGSALLG